MYVQVYVYTHACADMHNRLIYLQFKVLVCVTIHINLKQGLSMAQKSY